MDERTCLNKQASNNRKVSSYMINWKYEFFISLFGRCESKHCQIYQFLPSNSLPWRAFGLLLYFSLLVYMCVIFIYSFKKRKNFFSKWFKSSNKMILSLGYWIFYKFKIVCSWHWWQERGKKLLVVCITFSKARLKPTGCGFSWNNHKNILLNQ